MFRARYQVRVQWGDCDDDDPANFPGNPEVCDGQNNDCAFEIDEDFDGDGDGYTPCGIDGITANAIAPGNVVTPMNADLRADPDWAAKMRQRTPTGEDFIPAADMAGAVGFLASDDARAVHGIILPVDSGWRAW